MPRGPTVGNDEDDDGFELGDLKQNQTVVVTVVMTVVLSVVGLSVAASAGIGFFGHTEVTPAFEDSEVYQSDLRDNGTAFVVEVTDEDGQPVTEGEVSVSGLNGELEAPATARVGYGSAAWDREDAGPTTLPPHHAGFWFSMDSSNEGPHVEIPDDQTHGQLAVEYHPPPDSSYDDQESNPTVFIIRD